MSLAPGRIVGERYRVANEIASGGMGSVYRVERVRDGVQFAFKVIRRDLSPGPTTVERFRREARILGTVAHPGVVQMVDAGLMKDGSAFLVMELLEGETLLDFFRREAPVTAGEFAHILRGMAAGLDAVHGRGVVHRDLKPSNVFLTGEGVKLVDFGIAQATHLTRLTLTGQMVGTVRYMAPEQFTGGEVDHRADVYALGVMSWSALAGGPPFVGKGMLAVEEILGGAPRLEEEVAGLGRDIADIVHQAMAKDRDDRFTSAGAFAAAFASAAVRAPKKRARRRTGFAPIPTTRTGVTAPRTPRRTSAAPGRSSTGEATQAERRRMLGWGVGGGMAALGLVAVVALLVTDFRPGPDGHGQDPPATPSGAPTAFDVDASTSAAAAPLVLIESEPSGALVKTGGVVLGNTPMRYPVPTDGSRVTLEVSAPSRRMVTLELNEASPRWLIVHLSPAEEVAVPGENENALGERSTPIRRRQTEFLDNEDVPVDRTAPVRRVQTESLDPWRE